MGAARFPEQIEERVDAARRESETVPDPIIERLKSLPNDERFSITELRDSEVDGLPVIKLEKKKNSKRTAKLIKKSLGRDKEYDEAARRRNAVIALGMLERSTGETFSETLRTELETIMYDLLKLREIVQALERERKGKRP